MRLPILFISSWASRHVYYLPPEPLCSLIAAIMTSLSLSEQLDLWRYMADGFSVSSFFIC
jgi:hypothetical protein